LMLAVLLHRVARHCSVWWAVLFSLAVPFFGGPRSDVLRDWPAWFFMLLSIWLYLKYRDVPRWRWSIGMLVALICAVLSRLEAGIIAAPLFLSYIFDRSTSVRNTARLIIIPCCIAVIGIFWL